MTPDKLHSGSAVAAIGQGRWNPPIGRAY